MKLLTIYTHRYSQQLNGFTTRAEAGDWITTSKAATEGGVFSVNYRYNQQLTAFTKGLMALLADIAIQENPIYQHSPKLQSMAYDLRKTPLYEYELKSLAGFIKHSRILHLEGYVTFRMADYRDKLDMMSYTLIKKLKLNQQD